MGFLCVQARIEQWNAQCPFGKGVVDHNGESITTINHISCLGIFERLLIVPEL